MTKIFSLLKNKIILFVLFLNILFLVFFSFSWILFILLLICMFLFRNLNYNRYNVDLKAILSPMDGKILSIQKVKHKDLGECLQIYIKNRIYDVGYIRPISNLKINEIKQIHGLSLNDDLELVKLYNEKIIFNCDIADKKVIFRIHKGSFDRKIKVFNHKDELSINDDFGFTLNGYVSILLPVDSRILANVNDDVKAGSLIAYIS